MISPVVVVCGKLCPEKSLYQGHAFIIVSYSHISTPVMFVVSTTNYVHPDMWLLCIGGATYPSQHPQL